MDDERQAHPGRGPLLEIQPIHQPMVCDARITGSCRRQPNYFDMRGWGLGDSTDLIPILFNAAAGLGQSLSAVPALGFCG